MSIGEIVMGLLWAVVGAAWLWRAGLPPLAAAPLGLVVGALVAVVIRLVIRRPRQPGMAYQAAGGGSAGGLPAATIGLHLAWLATVQRLAPAASRDQGDLAASMAHEHLQLSGPDLDAAHAALAGEAMGEVAVVDLLHRSGALLAAEPEHAHMVLEDAVRLACHAGPPPLAARVVLAELARAVGIPRGEFNALLNAATREAIAEREEERRPRTTAVLRKATQRLLGAAADCLGLVLRDTPDLPRPLVASPLAAAAAPALGLDDDGRERLQSLTVYAAGRIRSIDRLVPALVAAMAAVPAANGRALVEALVPAAREAKAGRRQAWQLWRALATAVALEPERRRALFGDADRDPDPAPEPEPEPEPEAQAKSPPRRVPPAVRDALELLDLDPHVDLDAVRSAYRAKMREMHPDAHAHKALPASVVQLLEQQCARLAEAHDLLQRHLG